jgi:hypothetical protein
VIAIATVAGSHVGAANDKQFYRIVEVRIDIATRQTAHPVSIFSTKAK